MNKDFLTITPESGGYDWCNSSSLSKFWQCTNFYHHNFGGVSPERLMWAKRLLVELLLRFSIILTVLLEQVTGGYSLKERLKHVFRTNLLLQNLGFEKRFMRGDTLISEDFSKSGNNKITVVPTNTSYYDVTILSEYGERVQFMKKSGAPSSVSCYYDITVQYMGAGGTATASFHLYN